MGVNSFLDTNAIIALLKGNNHVSQILDNASWVGTSAVCVIEYLFYPTLSVADTHLFYAFIQTIEIVGVVNNATLLQDVTLVKKQYNLKLPDVIIASQALAAGASLVSNDRHINNISNLNVIHFELP